VEEKIAPLPAFIAFGKKPSGGEHQASSGSGHKRKKKKKNKNSPCTWRKKKDRSFSSCLERKRKVKTDAMPENGERNDTGS